MVIRLSIDGCLSCFSLFSCCEYCCREYGCPIWHTAFKRLLKKKMLGIVQKTETSPISPQSHKGLFLKTFCLFLILIRLLPIFMKSKVRSCDGSQCSISVYPRSDIHGPQSLGFGGAMTALLADFPTSRTPFWCQIQL